ncbi:MAG: LuxR C-terminal-related transcriptional regulator [Nannocystaceae bacterium]
MTFHATRTSLGPMREIRLDRLTQRQRGVLELVAKGLTNDEIASVLGIGAETVKSHVSALLRVLEVDNRTEAAGLLNAIDPGQAPDFEARPAIAVLAFDLSGWEAAEAQAFTLGLVDDLILLLSQWRWFPVIARASSLAVDLGAHRTSSATGRALGARYLLRGAVRRGGERLRITVFLEDAERDITLWSERYEADLNDFFAVQDEIAREIVGSVYPHMISAEVWRARRSRAKNLSTWTLTHQGIWHIERRSREDSRVAHELLDRALAGDEAFLPALHAKGVAFFHDGVNQWNRDIAGCRAHLERFAEAAVHHFPEAPHGHMLRARVAMGRGDMAGAVHHVERATAINPSLASGHALRGQLLATLGRYDDGLESMRRAHRLSPRAYVAGIGIALFAAGRYLEALAAVEPVLVERPSYLFARMIAAAAHYFEGDLEAAARHAAELRRIDPEFRTSQLRRVVAEHPLETADRFFDALRSLGVPE